MTFRDRSVAKRDFLWLFWLVHLAAAVFPMLSVRKDLH